MVTRRKFLKNSSRMAVLCCSTGLVSFLESCVNTRYINASETSDKLFFSKSELSKDKFVLVKSKKADAPIYLIQTDENKYSAFLMICTHKECEVKPTGNFITCPCHGSEFSNAGKVLKGPADKDLFQYQVTTDETNIYIHLK